ncbi:MAG: hypothetical protein IPP47_07550 [Bryobacterales bacterium]|nr:hypothetical protein [Bryobacterales bacterium]
MSFLAAGALAAQEAPRFSPPAAGPGEYIELIGNGISIDMAPQFPGPNGTFIEVIRESGMPRYRVPQLARSGRVEFVNPYTGERSAITVPFRRLPNLRVHAPSQELSAGERLQLAVAIFGDDPPAAVTWRAQAGSRPEGSSLRIGERISRFVRAGSLLDRRL